MTDTTVSTAKPPDRVNRVMVRALRTPGLQSMLGRSIAVLTFTGRRSGRQITIPVSYVSEGDRVFVMTKTARNWWRNFAQEPAVRLRLKGVGYTGTARAVTDIEERIAVIVTFLQHRPLDARAYGVKLGRDKVINDEDVRRLAPQVVPIEITLD